MSAGASARPSAGTPAWEEAETQRWYASPAWTDVLVDHEFAVMTKRTFDGLMEYSTSTPTGTIIGKRWKRQEMEASADGLTRTWTPSGIWWLAEYCPDPRPDTVGILWRRILIVENKEK